MLKIIGKHGVGKLKSYIFQIGVMQMAYRCHLLFTSFSTRPKISFLEDIGGQRKFDEKIARKSKFHHFEALLSRKRNLYATCMTSIWKI